LISPRATNWFVNEGSANREMKLAQNVPRLVKPQF